VLVIRSTATRSSPSNNWTNITSGGVSSQQKQAWNAPDGSRTRICVRSMLPGGIGSAANCSHVEGCSRPAATGVWATHWMMPDVNQSDPANYWPCRGEIDMLEMIDGNGLAQGT
jgi:hypothetical protein